MQIQLECDVMSAILLSHSLKNIQSLRFNQLAFISGLKKSTLHTVLNRLVNRGWIKKTEIPEYSVALGNFKSKKIKQYNTYSLNYFPYVEGNLDTRKVKNKKFWKVAAKNIQKYLRTRPVVYNKEPSFRVEEEGSVTKLKTLRLGNGHVQLSHPKIGIIRRWDGKVLTIPEHEFEKMPEAKGEHPNMKIDLRKISLILKKH